MARFLPSLTALLAAALALVSAPFTLGEESLAQPKNKVVSDARSSLVGSERANAGSANPNTAAIPMQIDNTIPLLSLSEMEITVSPIRRDLGGSDCIFELLLGKTVAIADSVRVIEFSQGKGFPHVTEEGYSAAIWDASSPIPDGSFEVS